MVVGRFRYSRAHKGLTYGQLTGNCQSRIWLGLILMRNTSNMERNHSAFVRMSRGIEVGGKFRAPVPRKQRGFARGAAQQFSAAVYTVAAVLQQGRQVRAEEDGKVYSTKLVLPVAAGSAAAGRALERAAARRTAQVRGQRGGQG